MDSIETVSINDIQIGERHRQDLGDIDGLAQSISSDGLLQPIGITPNNRLVFGYRRLVAYRDVLNRATIPAVVIDIENLTHAEWIENTIRKNFDFRGTHVHMVYYQKLSKRARLARASKSRR